MGELIWPIAADTATCLYRGLFVPFDAARSLVASLCCNLVVRYPDLDENELQLVGSCTAVRYRGHHIILATRHQLANSLVNLETCEHIGVFLFGSRRLVTSSGVFCVGTEEMLKNDNRYDLIAFYYDEPAAEFPELRDRFFDVAAPWAATEEHILECFAVGYPFCDQGVDLWDARHLNAVRRNLACEHLPSSPARHLDTVRNLNGELINPDGMSGGVVMFIRRDAAFPRVEFGGIIQLGGNSYLHYLPAKFVCAFMDAAITHRFSSGRSENCKHGG